MTDISPVAVVRRYVDELYNEGRVELVDEICGEPLVRHSADGTIAMTRAEQTARIEKDLATHDPKFTVASLFGDENRACLTWNARRLTTGEELCGIEIFAVADGVITDVWNSNYFEGSWQ